ncbi:MAG TPA: thioredoxin [bacterium]|uniref:Thioredoxin n=1 Tax=candidate division TA06 bacterium ADurb.Bin417 TaxID=1852828 RepID=A0A1V5MH49_UNCT6|nr:MAG: Thioredoxin C-1 [candidate division TA06 bacterium ADurb.Bin417]HNQ36214.1 thioredoxin [bacterium]
MEIILDENNFEQEVKEGGLPVLVDFWAAWCGPCQMLGPVITQVAEEYQGKVKVGKVNVDENPNLAGKFGIMGIPTMILFINGEEKERLVGVAPKERITKLLDALKQ